MSHDQRPTRVRVVTASDAVVVEAGGKSDPIVPVTDGADAARAAGGGMILPTVLFCAGCALGGAALAAVILL